MITPLELKILLVIGAYLLGSVPFGLLLARGLAGVDVRQVGSGNIGATNVSRTVGKPIGVLTLLLDASKAAAPMLLARWWLAPEGAPAQNPWVVAVGLAAFFGHLFPVWLRFRGGKGVATALGLFLVLSPWATMAGLIAFAGVVALTRIVSLGSLAATAVVALGGFLQHGPSSPVSWTGLVAAGAIALKHRSNIGRLVRGEEPPIS